VCFSNCIYEDSRTGECTGKPKGGLRPCEEGYADAVKWAEYYQDREAEARAEMRREK